jgi:hypothetical protein
MTRERADVALCLRFGGQAMQHALHGVIAAGVAVIALKGGMGRGALHAGGRLAS